MPPLPGRKDQDQIDARNRLIFERWLAGEKLESIGDSYGVTRERIRQIIARSQAYLPEPEDPKIIDRIIARKTVVTVVKREQLKDRMSIKQKLKKLFEASFDRDEIILALGLSEDPDVHSCSDTELCEMAYAAFGVRRFFTYMRCSVCEEIKPLAQFSPCAIRSHSTCMCRPCNTARHREQMLKHPEYLSHMLKRQKEHPNLAKMYILRSYLRRHGREDEIPPLPPRGIPDHEIVVPKILAPKGHGLKKWRESVGRTFNRAKVAEKAKQLVKEDARQRHIAI